MKVYRRIIKIGNSFGVTFLKNDLERIGINKDDFCEITVKKVR